MSHLKVLCVSFDKVVSDARCAALEKAGYRAVSTTRIADALDLLPREKFDLVIVGHRLPMEDKYVLTVEAKEKSDTPVLLVCGASPDSEIPASARVYAVEGTSGLVEAAAALVPIGAGAASRKAA